MNTYARLLTMIRNIIPKHTFIQIYPETRITLIQMKTKKIIYECIQPIEKRLSYFGCKKHQVSKECAVQNGSKGCRKLITLTTE